MSTLTLKQRPKITTGKLNVVLIRKSGSAQDEQGQISKVRKMLDAVGINVPQEHWFICTVPRAHVSGNADWRRMLDLVEADKVRMVYVERQDRFGTDDVSELFTMLGVLRSHRSGLYDLTGKIDLTGKDDTTLMTAFINGIKSTKERRDTAQRAMRTKVNHFLATGSWPTGVHPFGFGKRRYRLDGTLIFEWQPTSRKLGDLFFPDKAGKLKLGQRNVPIPAKVKGELAITKLVHSNNKEYVKTVRLIFEWFTRVGLTRRQITKRLNDQGRKFYDQDFKFNLVGEILTNPAYVGDTHFGKTKTATNFSFSSDGMIEEIHESNGKEKRDEDERLIKKGTHKGLIDRRTWELAEEKIADQRLRLSYAPRNPAYYLKEILFAGIAAKI